MPAYAPSRQPQAREGSSFPFMQWFGRLLAEHEGRRERSRDNEDFLIGDEAMKSFAIAAEQGRVFAIGAFAEDLQAIASVPWTSAALIRGHQNRDWVALACKDARVRGSKEMNPLQMRLWFPVPAVKVDVFKEVQPNTLRLREMAMNQGRPALKNVPPMVEVPLSLRGGW
jgi:hypothetical protein